MKLKRFIAVLILACLLLTGSAFAAAKRYFIS